MRYPKLRELKEAIRALIRGPYTSDYPSKPHKPYERFRGRPKFSVDDCTGCTACVQVCPAGALSFKDETVGGKAVRTLTIRWDICICCGLCQANCLTDKGIVLSNEFDYATTGKREDLFQSIEKELVTCDCCGDLVLPFDQYLWVAQKLGPLCFANTSLIIAYLAHLSLAMRGEPVKSQDLDVMRSDRMKILCPRCRRQAVLKS
jgi:formate hydrogenlyase subunit 6/NADH:ubiquinone oxidoreductase subunit I